MAQSSVLPSQFAALQAGLFVSLVTKLDQKGRTHGVCRASSRVQASSWHGMLLLILPSIAFTDKTEATVTAATAVASATDQETHKHAGDNRAHDSCSNDLDCQLNGECIEQGRECPPDGPGPCSHKCVCDPGWGGDDCGDLQLEVGEIAYGCYPTVPLTCDYSSWGGGPPVFDTKHRVWVMFQDEISKHCGLSEWSYMSTIVRTSSTNGPAGPYKKDEVVLGTQSHNAYYVHDPKSGKHLIYHVNSGTGGKAEELTGCTNGTTPRKSGAELERLRAPKPLRSDGVGDTTCEEAHDCLPPVIHESTSLSGPWKRVGMRGVYPPQFPTTNGGTRIRGALNPAPVIFDNGTVLALYKVNQTIWAMRAPDYRGPYEAIGEIFHPFAKGSFTEDPATHVLQEDPTLWRDARGNFHALMHPLGNDGAGRGHGFSYDGVTWHWSDPSHRGRTAFQASIKVEGKTIPVTDVERLRIWVNPKTGHPELLFYASGGQHQPVHADGLQRSFTVVQRIRTTAPVRSTVAAVKPAPAPRLHTSRDAVQTLAPR